jgi:NTP pyrophosphatase (non-canonical NTP hydrolase)
MDIADFQALIATTYGARDRSRGPAAAVAWLAEEVGELARALRKGTGDEQAEAFADVLAWLVSLAALAGIDLDAAVTARYGAGCPKCTSNPCSCPSVT